jgi:hypothetical protein
VPARPLDPAAADRSPFDGESGELHPGGIKGGEVLLLPGVGLEG